jgi:hypothetical protein
MRRRTGKFLPIVLIALMVQIFAPVGATWAAGIAASDPLGAAAICHGDGGSTGQSDQTGGHRAHDGACSMCCVAHATGSADTPQTATVTTPYRKAARAAWLDTTPDLFRCRTGSHAQARAPPQLT